MDWRVDFTIEANNDFNIQFQQAETTIAILLDPDSNEAPLTEIVRAVIQVWYGTETEIFWYDYRQRYLLLNTFVFRELDLTEDLLFEIQETDLNKEGYPDSLPLQIRDSREAICQMFWKGLRRFQGAGLVEQYNAVFGHFPEAEVNKLTQLLKAPKR